MDKKHKLFKHLLEFIRRKNQFIHLLTIILLCPIAWGRRKHTSFFCRAAYSPPFFIFNSARSYELKTDQKRAYFVRRDIVGVLEQGLSSETLLKDTNGLQTETRSNFRQFAIFPAFFQFIDFSLGFDLIFDLVITHPDTVIDDEEGEDVVDEGLGLGVALWNSKNILK